MVLPSGEKALPPTLVVLLIAVRGNGALAELACAITFSVAEPYSVNPALNRSPSGDMERPVDCPVTNRLRRIVPEATSYTYVTVWVLLFTTLTPTMKFPSGVRN